MTDRELLELAAKAAGVSDASFDADMGCITYHHEAGPYGAQFKTWNPLTDDGDALRLAAKLEIETRNFNGKSHAGRQGKFWCTEAWFPDGDPYAATRRAIVRAAATIEKAKP